LILVDGNTAFEAEVGGAELHELSVAQGNQHRPGSSQRRDDVAADSDHGGTARDRIHVARASPSEQNAWEPGLARFARGA
jgi:hypothetical protein